MAKILLPRCSYLFLKSVIKSNKLRINKFSPVFVRHREEKRSTLSCTFNKLILQEVGRSSKMKAKYNFS